MSVRLLVLSDAGEGDLCMAARLNVGRAALLVEDGAVEASCERTTFGEKLVAVAAAGGLGRCSSVAADLGKGVIVTKTLDSLTKRT